MNDWSWGWSEVVTSVGILVSATFSFLLWRVSRESTKAAKESAAAAAASTRIAEELEAQRIQKNKILKREILKPVKNQASYVIQELLRIKDPNTQSAYFFTARQHIFEFPTTSLAEYLTEEELEVIELAWSFLNELIKNYLHMPNQAGYQLTAKVRSDLEFESVYDQTLEAFRLVTRL